MNKPSMYEIQLEGLISDNWSDWFEGLVIQHPADDETIFRGALLDQAALLGLLSKIHSMNLKIIAVARMPAGTQLDTNQ